MLKILNRVIDSTHRPLLPNQIKETSPLWKEDIQRFTPWKFTDDKNYLISGQKLQTNILVAGECSSTFDLTDFLIEEGELTTWDALIAVSQRQGRGRRKREWISPPGNLYVSLLLPEISSEWQNTASLLTGYCLNSALKELGCSTSVKWPNDILLNGKKVGGILIEQKKGRAVLGFGLNLTTSPEHNMLCSDGAFAAGCLFEPSADAIGPISIWDYLVKRFKKLYYSFAEGGSTKKLITVLEPQLAFINEEVLVRKTEQAAPIEAIFIGINSSGFARFLINGQDCVLREAKILPK